MAEKKTADETQQMSDVLNKDENGISDSSSYIGTGLGGILLILEIFALLCRGLSGYWAVLADFPVAMDDAGVFLNLLCVGWMIYALLRHAGSSLFYFLYALNILLINHLYSNKTWDAVYVFVKRNWRGAVWIIVVALVVIGIFVISFWSYFRNKKARQLYQSGRRTGRSVDRREDSSRTTTLDFSTEDKNDSMRTTEERSDGGNDKSRSFNEIQGTNEEYQSGRRTGRSVDRREDSSRTTTPDFSTEDKNDSMRNMEERSDSGNDKSQSFNEIQGTNEENGTHEDASDNDINDIWKPFITIAYFFGILSVVLLIVDFIVYDQLNLGFVRPEIMSANLNVIRMIEILLGVAAVCVVFVKSFVLNRRVASDGAIAIIAVVIEAVFILKMDRIKELDFTSKFMNTLTENAFGIFLVIVITYLVIHIFLSIAVQLVFKDAELAEGKRITALLKINMYRLEEKMVTFSCDILWGILNLLCFIPDFFSTIGYTLLDKENMFHSVTEDETNGGKRQKKQG